MTINITHDSTEQSQTGGKKVLLALLPFWSPLIPPIGIASLKSYLKPRGIEVKTVDAAVEDRFMTLYYKYFNLLKQAIPEERRGNFYSIGHDVLRNHLMAALELKEDDPANAAFYSEAVKDIIYMTYYTKVDDSLTHDLKQIIADFYKALDGYLAELFAEELPAVFGLTVYSDTLPASLFSFRWVKEKYPEITTYMGGGVFADQLAPGSPNWEIFLEKTKKYIDKIIIGEGEILFFKSLKGELPPSQRVYTLEDINREIVRLEMVDILDMSDFDMDRYPFNLSYTSRSCPFQCKFCSETLQWGRYRKKPVTQIVEEAIRLHKKYGNQLILFSDSLLNPVMKYLPGEFLKKEDVIYWEGWLRVDKYSADIMNTFTWRRSGFYQARLGIESGSPHVLTLMNKKITIPEIKESIANLAAAGIKTTTLWVVGYPGETAEDFQQTLDLIEELRYDIYEAECRPFYYYLTGQPGSINDSWIGYKPMRLYPEEYDRLLVFRTWILDGMPDREEIYDRVNRFVLHCEKLGIPNPYSLREIYEADERWKQLHKNSVPPLTEFKKPGSTIDECRGIHELLAVPDSLRDIEEF